MIEWTEVDNSVLDLAQELIHKYHRLLKEARIGFVFRSESSFNQGKETVSKSVKVEAKYNALLESYGETALDFLIWIAKPVWDGLSEKPREALLDHELCHCKGFPGSWKIEGHDFEEFQEIIERHGFWNIALFRSAGAFQKAIQMDLGLHIEHPGLPVGGVVAVDPAGVQAEGES